MTTTATSDTRLILVRHGESNVTVQGIIGGPLSCTGLSPLGDRQAQALRDRFDRGTEPPVDRLWSSTMPRATQTAHILNETLGLELTIEADLEERRPGQVDGMTFDAYREAFDADALANPHTPISPGGESQAQFTVRVGQAIEAVVAAGIGKTSLVVCHGGVIDVVFRELLGIAAAARFYLWSLNTSLTEFVLAEPGPPRLWRLARYNDSTHLDGLPNATVTDRR